jgi:hypothetical protein
MGEYNHLINIKKKNSLVTSKNLLDGFFPASNKPREVALVTKDAPDFIRERDAGRKNGQVWES